MNPEVKRTQLERIETGLGFVAALDQSGGSTPSALERYGIDRTAYQSEDEMFALVQRMRERIVTAHPFVGYRILAAILFEKTMDSQVNGHDMPSYLWEDRGVISFLKIDQGLADLSNGVQLMNPIPNLNALISRALERGVLGTKMRSVIRLPVAKGISRLVQQQFQLAHKIHALGLIPIVEPEVSTELSDEDRVSAERLLKQDLVRSLEDTPKELRLILKLTIPVEPNFYQSLVAHPRVLRVLALSGGFSRIDACRRLMQNGGIIASFSRALLEDLRFEMSDSAFNQTLALAIDEIFFASVGKNLVRNKQPGDGSFDSARSVQGNLRTKNRNEEG